MEGIFRRMNNARSVCMCDQRTIRYDWQEETCGMQAPS
jgi:hypothetical protein